MKEEGEEERENGRKEATAERETNNRKSKQEESATCHLDWLQHDRREKERHSYT